MSQEIIVLCHTIFHDIFRSYPNAGDDKIKEQEASKFILRYLIETRNDPNKKLIALTSEQVLRSLEYNLPNQGMGGYPAQITLALRNLVIPIEGKVSNLKESIIVISDILSSFGRIKMVSNMSKMKIHVIEFYQTYEESSRRIKEVDVPFQILTACDIEDHLRTIDPSNCEIIDKRVSGEL